jgi:hypothetical protein
VRLRRGEDEIRPFELVAELSNGDMPAVEWWERASALGIADVALAA